MVSRRLAAVGTSPASTSTESEPAASRRPANRRTLSSIVGMLAPTKGQGFNHVARLRAPGPGWDQGQMCRADQGQEVV